METEHAGTSKTDATDASDRFTQLDTDGDGSLSQTEFEAGRPQGGQGPQGAGGMPPPPPGGMGASGSASTDYDPLDTNEDGTVSAAERAAGAASNNAVQALFQAIDSDGDNTISSSESDAFIQALTAQTDTAASSAQSTESDTWSSQSALAQLVSRAYQQIASDLNRSTQGNALNALA